MYFFCLFLFSSFRFLSGFFLSSFLQGLNFLSCILSFSCIWSFFYVFFLPLGPSFLFFFLSFFLVHLVFLLCLLPSFRALFSFLLSISCIWSFFYVFFLPSGRSFLFFFLSHTSGEVIHSLSGPALFWQAAFYPVPPGTDLFASFRITAPPGGGEVGLTITHPAVVGTADTEIKVPPAGS